jgi:hypothetical protein
LSLVLAGVASAAFLVGTSVAAPPPPPAPVQDGPTYVYRVPAPLGQKAQDLLARGFDVLEQRDGDDLFVLGSKDVHAKLAEAGYTGTVESVMAPPLTELKTQGSGIKETYYGGYRTVKAHHAHLDQVAWRYPRLATLVDYGDSWRKTQGAGGYDLKAVCLTKKSPGDCRLTPNARKPRLFVSAQIHAREITTGDMAWRWIDHLTTGYGSSASSSPRTTSARSGTCACRRASRSSWTRPSPRPPTSRMTPRRRTCGRSTSSPSSSTARA